MRAAIFFCDEDMQPASGGGLSMIQVPRLKKEKMAVCAGLFFGLALVTCTTAPEQNAPAATLGDMHAATPVAGWVESQGQYQGFTDATFDSFFYDPTYITYHTLVNGFITMYQNATAAETLTANAIVMDYGTAANAAAVWDTITKDRATRNHMVDVPGFTIYAIGSQMYHELYVFACFDKFYVELDLKTYASDSVAMSDACKFLTKYKAITGVQ
jgi:hypothetical protein